MFELNAISFIGYLGALVLVVGLLLNQFGRWQTTDFEYDFINLIGAAILCVYALQTGDYPILGLFLIWGAFHLKDVFVDGFRNLKKGKEIKKVAKEAVKEAKEEVKEEVKEESAADIMKPESEEKSEEN
ncbi:hypothetical protein ACFL3T_01520 [Patescibacteria group bacterium]